MLFFYILIMKGGITNMNKEEAEKKYLEYLEGHIDNVKSALDILISLDIICQCLIWLIYLLLFQ